MIPLLLDQGLPRRSAADLRDNGWDVVHVGEIDMSRATDAEILAAALAQGRAVVTLDSDFSKLMAESGATAPSIVFIRIHRSPAAMQSPSSPTSSRASQKSSPTGPSSR